MEHSALDRSSFARFALWLESSTDYRPRTIAKVLADTRTMCATGGVPPRSIRSERLRDFQWCWDLWADFREEVGPDVPSLAFPRPELPTTRRRRRRDRPVHEARSIESGEWERLRAEVARSARVEARVIAVLMASGLRISDVLRTRPLAVLEALMREDGIARLEVKGGKIVEVPVRGGAERAWLELLAAVPLEERDRAPSFADVVAPGSTADAGGAAYQRVATALRAIGARAGVAGRLHLHRLRRTVGVQLLSAGVELETVSKVFGHSDIRTTQRYTSEPMARLAGEALRKINR